jgi:polar amino acid transport system substrate-binding protein
MTRIALYPIRRAPTKGKQMTRAPGFKGPHKALAFALLLAAFPMLSFAQTLDRIQSSSKLVLGYEANARPFSFDDEAGKPQGYAVALCGKVADEVKAQLNLPGLVVEWKPVEMDDRFNAIRDGRIDLLCGADSVTLSLRKEVSFSLPVFPSGTGVVLRSDAPAGLREILLQEQPRSRPIWRGAPARTFLEQKTFSAVAGTTSEAWVTDRLKTLQLSSVLVPVATYEEGIQRVLDQSSAALFGALPILLDAAALSDSSDQLAVLPRHFTYEPLAFALARNDEDFRLLVDTALSHAYREDGFRDLFTTWFGTPDESFIGFFKQTVLPD